MADPIIFFDMDGVLAKWDTESAVEDTFLPGYFHFIVSQIRL